MGSSNHISMKSGKVGRGLKHHDYVLGKSRYSRDDVMYTEHGNVPLWSEDIAHFWQSADNCERANGRAYSEIEFALPRELGKDDQIKLARLAVSQWLGDRHTYTLAVHDREAADGGRNVHAHLMFSERVNDGINRPTPEAYFKRAAVKDRDPASGGAKKDRNWNRKARVFEIREEWAKLANDFLAGRGHDRRMDTRSNSDRGLRSPEPKLGPKKRGDRPDPWREEREVKVKTTRMLKGARESLAEEVRQIRAEQAFKQAEAERLKEEARQRQEAAERIKVEQERERFEKERAIKRERDKDRGLDYGR